MSPSLLDASHTTMTTRSDASSGGAARTLDSVSTPTGPQPRAVLELVEVPRVPPAPGVDERAEYLPWLRGQQRQLEFVIDGLPLHRRLLAVPAPDDDTTWLGEPFDMTSVADLSWPAHTADDLRRLAGTQPRDDGAWPLAPGRLPLYVCPMCADLGCGAITVHIDHSRPGQVTWSRLLHESGLSTEYDLDLSAAGTFTFDADAYRQVLLALVGVLEALAADERAAKARHRRELPQRHARRWLDRIGLRTRR